MVLSITAAAFALIAGGLLALVGIIQIIVTNHSGIDSSLVFVYGLVMMVLGILLLPFSIHKIKSISGKAIRFTGSRFFSRFQSPVFIVVLFFFWGGTLLLGHLVITRGITLPFLFPILTILAVIIPITLFVSLVIKRSDSLQSSRGWGALSAGIVISPLVGTLIELGAIAIALMLFFLFISQNTAVIGELEMTLNRLAGAQDNPDILTNVLTAFFARPVNRFLLLSLLSGFIPIIEEAVKQIPLWLLAWHKPTPRMGAMIGAMGGAGFALTESLLTVPVLDGSDQWWFQLLGRAGAGLMHITTGAIGGWGLASAVSGRGYIKAALSYLISIIIHAVWNGLVTIEGITQMISPALLNSWQLTQPGNMPLILLGVTFILLLVFLMFNDKLLKG
ncbi:MAG: PrsW family intramembrane metalloprotease [Anaerolineaceae bacterium]|nr:PrsW family intramembrane metalloprotease [Anaerolineaceae bacterium]